VSLWETAGPLVVGHRGGRGEGWPGENTIAAFDQARAQGARAIELDVRTCGTGEIVVHHDPTAESAASLAARGVPTLAETLAWAVDRGVAVNVEMKRDVPDRLALVDRVWRVLRGTRADVLLSSFDPLLLAAMAAALPRVPRALLTSRDQRRHLPQRLVARPYVQAIHLERTQTAPAVVARFRRRGIRVGGWTVNDPREAADLAAIGVGSLITDRAGAVIGALRERGYLDAASSEQVTGSTRIPAGGG
jgi:glycerophosphoryl diester phosphodiesterase